MCCKVLCKNSSVGIRIITTDDNDSSDAVLLTYISSDSKLLIGLKLGSAGSDDIEATGISELVDIFVSHNDIIILDQSARTTLEAIKLVLLVGCL